MSVACSRYAQGGHSPQNNPVQDAELRHNIRRLSSHPAIVMWDGCNLGRRIQGGSRLVMIEIQIIHVF